MENNEQPEIGDTVELITPEPAPLDTRRMRESKVLVTDIAGIREPNRAPKNFATNQGVREFVKQEVSKSELAIAHAMSEVYAQFNSKMVEAGGKFEALTTTFEKCIRIHSNLITQLESRVEFLETRWWERLMRDFEWDWYGIVDWIHHKFSWTSADVYVDVPEDPAILVLEDYLDPSQDSPEEGGRADCACLHSADSHDEEAPRVCYVEDCQCTAYTPLGSTLSLTP